MMPLDPHEALRLGWAPIKKEFLLPSKELDTDSFSPPDAAGPQNNNNRPPKKERRGVDRKREQKMAHARADVRNNSMRLCPSVLIENKECRFGEKCTASHDLDAFMEKKPADLGDSCPIYEQQGKCNFSFACRFANAHTDGKTQLTKEPNPEFKPLKNTIHTPIQIAMRKRTYDFSRAEQIVSALPEQLGAVEREKPKLDMRSLAGKPYLAPLTTVGNLPFRRLCVNLGAEITCGEMAIATSLLQGSPSEWSLLKRHPSEKIFGVQIVGGFPDSMARAAQMLVDEMEVDFIDVNLGCPLDVVNDKGGGCFLTTRPGKLLKVCAAMSQVMKDVPLTFKMRYGQKEGQRENHHIMKRLVDVCPPAMITLHPRSREQRYTKEAEWDYVPQCVEALDGKSPLWVCGDVLSPDDYYRRLAENPIDGIMIGRGALIKPWIFKEIQEKQLWDISASERLEYYKQFVNYGLEHWGSDDAGVETTRRFMLEWLSFAYRYIPVGVLDVLPPRINSRPPAYRARNELEDLLASPKGSDWVKITEMFLGPVPDGFLFAPKHKANSY